MKKITENVYITDDGMYASARLEKQGYVIVSKQISKYDTVKVVGVWDSLEEAKEWIRKYEDV